MSALPSSQGAGGLQGAGNPPEQAVRGTRGALGPIPHPSRVSRPQRALVPTVTRAHDHIRTNGGSAGPASPRPRVPEATVGTASALSPSMPGLSVLARGPDCKEPWLEGGSTVAQHSRCPGLMCTPGMGGREFGLNRDRLSFPWA